MYESSADPDIHWRFGSKKILLLLADHYPHDCNVTECMGGPPLTTGLDPGRDETGGTIDDLPLLTVMDTMLNFKRTLLTVVADPAYFDFWDCMARRTGGNAASLSSIPGLSSTVYDLVADELSVITLLELGTEPGFEDWLVEVIPSFYFNVSLTSPVSRTFQIRVCMPPGTPSGTYNFKIYAYGDGAVWAGMDVTVDHCIPAIPATDSWWWVAGILSLLLIFQGSFSRSLKS
jgi:hypothetical protein